MKIPSLLSIMFMSAVLVVLHNVPADAACTPGDAYTLTTPASTSATMGDATASIPLIVTNSNTSTTITFVHLEFNAPVYNISLLTTAPAGWTISQIKNAGAGQTFIEFTASGGGIAPGSSLTFNVVLTGTSNNPVPSAAADVSDTMNTGTYVKSSTCNSFSTGPFPAWPRRSLAAAISVTPLSVGAGGTLTLMLTVTNRSSAAQATVQPSPVNPSMSATGTAGAVLGSGPTPASTASLAVGASATYQWLYTASGSGSLQFCDAATASLGVATSNTVCSNYISVGNFTAFITVSPTQVVSGQNVTVIMTVTNNGTSPIQNLVPTLTAPPGSALVSGPTPTTIAKIVHAASSTFQWVYTLTGSVGQTFTFSGYATDAYGTGVNSVPTPAVSNSVTLSAYSVTVAPNQVPSGSASTFTFHVTNNGGYPLNKIVINTPSSATTPFVYSSATGGCAAPAWTVSAIGAPAVVTFSTPPGSNVPIGGACDFSVAYSSVPTVTTNTDFNFIVDIYDTLSGTLRGSLGAIVTVTAFQVIVTASPLSINPNCTSTIKAVVTPDPGNGSTVTFLESAGTLNPHTSTTASGQATSTLTAPNPYNPGLTSAAVTATYQGATGIVTVNFANGTTCGAVRKILDWREVIR